MPQLTEKGVLHMGLVATKPVFGVFDNASLKLVSSAKD